MATTIARFSVIKAGDIMMGRRVAVLVNFASNTNTTTLYKIKVNSIDYGADYTAKSVVIGDIVEIYIDTNLQSSWSSGWSGYKLYGDNDTTDNSALRYCLISSFDAEVDLTYIVGVDYIWYGRYRNFFRSSSSYPCCLATINSSAEIEIWLNTSYEYQRVFTDNTTLRYIANGNFIVKRPITYISKNGLFQEIFRGCSNLVSLPNGSFQVPYNSTDTTNGDTQLNFAYQSGLKAGVVGRSVDMINLWNGRIWYFADQPTRTLNAGQQVSYLANDFNQKKFHFIGNSVFSRIR